MDDFSDSEIRRVFLSEDADQIREMQSKAHVFRDHYPQHQSWLDMALREVLQGKRVAFGAYRSGFNERHVLTLTLAGSIILKLNQFNRTVELKNLFVAETSRKRGYGRGLLVKCEDYCTKAGYAEVEAEVPTNEVTTVSFLHKMGFQVATTYKSPYRSGDSLYKMTKPLKLRFTGDFFDLEAFSYWYFGAVMGFSNVRRLSESHCVEFDVNQLNIDKDRHGSESTLARGMAYICADPVSPTDLETAFLGKDHHLFMAFCSQFSPEAARLCAKLRIKCFDQSIIHTGLSSCFAHQPMSFRREEIGGFVLSMNHLLFTRLNPDKEGFTLFKNGSLGKYLNRGNLLVIVSEPSVTQPLGGCRGVATIEDVYVGTSKAVWDRFSTQNPVFDQDEFNSYTREKPSVLAIRVSAFQFIASVDYITLVRDIIQQNVDVAELGCCYLSKEMADRFQKMTARMPKKSQNRYDFAISFASEDREYAEKLAQILEREGCHVFYDKYEADDLLGKDLYQHMQYVYRNSAMFCVIFISHHYAQKLWTRHELKHAQARAFEQQEEYILPIRVDDTEIPGLSYTTGYVDLRTAKISEIADILLSKLRKKASDETNP